MFGSLAALDAAVFHWINSLSIPGLDALMVALSTVARAGALWVVLGIVAVLRKRTRLQGLVQLVLAILVANLASDHVLKPLVDRQRPYDAMANARVVVERPDTASWPSGHAAHAGAGAVAVSALWPAARGVAWTLAVLVALSRVHVGVHYPFDVAAGLLIGALCGYWATGGTVWDRRWPSSD